ncbi:type I DNA topoisomerase [Faecalitalea cylindroides]|uniref:type I DNA topoisomerase n=1 Tax=Faecalitalea cylindroides TaxID=39483 RepID=UPI00189B111F|nr:type I DNA topoisomerase [Faecalitalea cylindroides]
MKKNLVIVESPSKSKTIEKYLGKDYKVVSSKGHICDLATSGKEGLGIDVDHDFEPTYKISKEKKDVVKELKELTKKAKDVYLASDPDREGEAIAWHLARVLDLDIDTTKRIVFHEVTKPAILEAMEHPKHIDMDLVRSQETRRMLDRIIGFKLSKLLQNKIRSKSAGRVQSVALKLIVERENEIKAFKSEEYWSVHANLKKGTQSFEATLSKVDGKKPKLKNEQQASEIVERSKGDFIATSITKRSKKKQPKLPFTTSTMQQEASTKLGFGARKTMSIAQKMYEGIDLGGQMQGLITYMRSDSTRLSDLFVKDTLAYIQDEYGKEYVGKAHTKNKANTQDAHEAIRPTDIKNTPESIKQYLTNDQYRLYSLIYARTLASLMKEASFNVTTITFEVDGLQYSASGQTMAFDGYTKVYKKYEKQTDELLPEIEENEVFHDVVVEPKQHFTEPPARYTEARLIKELEEKSIGRPSTYATIIDTLQKRGYATLEKTSETSKTKVFVPTKQGMLTDEKLGQYFSDVINVEYTADMEKTLDEIAEGKQDSIAYMHQFYDKFAPIVEDAYSKMPKMELEKVGRTCPSCGGNLVYRNGRYGKFISCINFPSCRYTENDEAEQENADPNQEEKICPNCGSKMIIKKGRYGPFWACSNYPECKTIQPLKEKAKPEPTGEMCPECGHELVKRKSRYGTTFIGCSNYPKCRYIKKEPKEKK